MAITAAVTAVTAVSTAYSIDQQKSAVRKQEKAQQLERNQQTVTDRRARAQASRENRIRRARILNAAEASGQAESSGVIGGLGGMQSSLGSAIAAQSGQANTADNVSRLNQAAAQNIFNAQMGEGVGTILNAGISAYGANSKLKTPETDFGQVGGMSPATEQLNIFGP